MTMTTGGWDDPAYPYSPRGGSAPPLPPNPRKPFPWRKIWRWVAPIAAVLAVVSMLVLVIGVGVVFRAARQAWSISELERLGAIVSYYPKTAGNQYSSFDDSSDRWWGEVREISHHYEDILENLFQSRELTEADVKQICALSGRFPKLQKFEIASDFFSCSQISGWSHLAMLEKLDITSAQLSDADLAIIGRMTELKSLSIAKAKISSSGLHHLARLSKLETLTLEQLQITQSSSPESNGFSALKTLVVGRSPDLGDELLASFGSPPLLEDLNVQQTPIGDQGLARLLQGGNVHSLIIHQGVLSDAALVEVAKHKAPGWLVLSGMPITDAALGALVGKEFPTLILDHTALTDQCFQTLAQIKGLDYVCLADTKVTGIGVKHLDPQQTLKDLDLSGNKLTREGIIALSKVNSEKLTLSRTPIGDGDILLFLSTEGLQQLDVTETSVTPNGIHAFYNARQNHLKALGVSGFPENLFLITDFPDLVPSILGIDPNTGEPLANEELAPDIQEQPGNENIAPQP